VRGIPNRILRGRVVEELRSSRSPLTLGTLGPRVLPDFRRHDLRGLRGVLEGLRRDGLIGFAGTGERITTEVWLA
jgi:hypothetical protein